MDSTDRTHWHQFVIEIIVESVNNFNCESVLEMLFP